MSELLNNYATMLESVEQAKMAHQADQVVIILAVSKTKPSTMVRQLFEEGQRDFGENYLQETLEKQTDLSDLAIVWHFIGHIQRNKTRDIAQSFDWVHTLSRDVIATRLSDQRPTDLPPLNVCIQVNIDDEDSKSGCLPSEALALAQHVIKHKNLRLRGLMVIPSKSSKDAFKRTKILFDEIASAIQSDDWDTLSMGMSGDFESAIGQGATIIRLGSAIFGART